VEECEEVKKIQKTKIKDEDAYDENDEGQIAADIDTLNEIIRRVMEVSGILFQLFKEDLNEFIKNNLSELFHKNWIQALHMTKVDQEILNSICFFSDYLEYGNNESFRNFYPTFFELTGNFQTTNEDILQSIIYAYGVIASRISEEEFPKYKDIILNSINTLISRPMNDNNSTTYDNACASYGRVIMTHFTKTAEIDSLAVNYLKMLPLKNCLVESEKTAMNLLKSLEAGNTILTNQNVFPEVKEAIKRINEFRVSEGEILKHEGIALMMLVQNKYQI
jgi:hypothetical protein